MLSLRLLFFGSVLALSVTFGDSSPKGGAIGIPHRFLYLFVDVYGILNLRSIPAILMGKGVTLWPIF